MPRPEIMPTLAEMSDSEKSDTEEGPPEDATTTMKDTPDKEDPFAALGSKLAKLRESRGSQTLQDIKTFTCVQDDFNEISDDWNATVAANLDLMENNPVETLWSRSSLFRYFQLMEALQENTAERQQLMKLAVEALVKLQDSQL